MPADPFRLRVLKALCGVIEGVTPANGFSHDLSRYEDEGGTLRPRVFRGRDLFGTGDPIPMVSILEHPRALEPAQGGGGAPVSTGGWDLLVQGFVQDDPDNPTDPAHVLAAEVISVLAAERARRNDLLGLGFRMPCVTEIEIGSPVVRPADATISTQAFFVLTVTLTLVEDMGRPFD